MKPRSQSKSLQPSQTSASHGSYYRLDDNEAENRTPNNGSSMTSRTAVCPSLLQQSRSRRRFQRPLRTIQETRRYSHSQGNKRPVLVGNETMDSLFLLTEKTPLEHRRLCKEIVEGPRADDVSSWRLALKEACNNPDNVEKGEDLIRLYERVEKRFPSCASIASSKSMDIASETSRETFAQEPVSSYHEENLVPAEGRPIAAVTNETFAPLALETNIIWVGTLPYAKMGVIGKGGSCKVYRALSHKSELVAIKKVNLKGKDSETRKSYHNEIVLLKKLQHCPGIIQIYEGELNVEREEILVAMELGEVDLHHFIKNKKPEALKIGSRFDLGMNFIRLTWEQMLKAVQSIHKNRIIHGDLKPANFLFVRGALKLIDFSIAKAMPSEDTRNVCRDSQIGTMNYMAPEAISPTASGPIIVGTASDVWSLGCILYQMVYGEAPFARISDPISKFRAIVNPNHKIDYPTDVEDEDALDAMKLCLQRSPKKRPPIVGKNGLLNEHVFLHAGRRPHNK